MRTSKSVLALVVAGCSVVWGAGCMHADNDTVNTHGAVIAQCICYLPGAGNHSLTDIEVAAENVYQTNPAVTPGGPEVEEKIEDAANAKCEDKLPGFHASPGHKITCAESARWFKPGFGCGEPQDVGDGDCGGDPNVGGGVGGSFDPG